MRRYTVPEKTFLINFALRQFNFQFKEKIVAADCDIRSIPPQGNYKLAYEIARACVSETFRLRLYLNLESEDQISPFRLEVKKNFMSGNTQDEFFASSGTIDMAHSLYDNYSFSWLSLEPCEGISLPYIMSVSNGPIGLVGGGGLLLA